MWDSGAGLHLDLVVVPELTSSDRSLLRVCAPNGGQFAIDPASWYRHPALHPNQRHAEGESLCSVLDPTAAETITGPASATLAGTVKSLPALTRHRKERMRDLPSNRAGQYGDWVPSGVRNLRCRAFLGFAAER